MAKLRLPTRFWAKCLAACVPMLCVTLATADDTDIFLGTSNPGASGVYPNVLFILDNSGSMQNTARDANGVSTGQTRMEAMKDAFSEIMGSVSGVNVGIMRFNAPGGSIDYPISNTDQVLETADLQTVPDMLVSADDASETPFNGVVTLDEQDLRMGFRPAGNPRSVMGYIQHIDDDREESNFGWEMDGAYINMNTSQISAVRYYDLDIPRGATILSARLEFTSPTSGYTGNAIIEISGQAADDPARFSGDEEDLADRYRDERTTNAVNWNIPNSQAWSFGGVYSSPDIKDVVQEIVNRPDWNNNNAMVLFLQGLPGSTGERAGTLFRNGSSNGGTRGPNGSNTKLYIEYSEALGNQARMTGLRFQQVNIPQGATITSARVNFIAASTVDTVDGLKLRVRAEDVDDAQAFTNRAFDLSARAKTTTQVIWEPEAQWTINESMTGPDITNVMQTVVNRAGWCGNNSVALYIEPTDDSPEGARTAYSVDGDLQQHAELVVSYTGGEAGCINQIWNKRVNSREDDAEEFPSGSVTNSSSDLDVENTILSGIRFEGIPAVQGATILDAYIEVAAYGNDSGAMNFKIHGHDTDNSRAFVNTYRNISQRTKTSNNITWSPVDFVDDQVYRSPALTDIVQEIVNRPGWLPGNAMSFILTPSGSNIDRDITTFDSSPGLAPRLILKIGDGGTSASTLTVASHINDLVQNLDARTWTPIVDSLYEAALYFKGAPMYYGRSRELFTPKHGTTSRRYKRVSVPNSYTGGTVIRTPDCKDDNLDSYACSSEYISTKPSAPIYNSPITNNCQSNHIVLLTDGEANNNHSISRIRALTGVANCDRDASDGDEKCGRTLAKWMADTDLAPALSAGKNTVNTHTIAFNLSNDNAVTFLEDLARLGGGTFNTANTSAELVEAFDAIIRDVISRDSTFTSPGATVNQFNRLTNREEIYFSVFKPESTPRWDGNLKRYKLRGDPAVIVDANDQEAIDRQTGFFKPSAQSVWSPQTDGATVGKGGAASRLPDDVTTRKVYTYLSGAAAHSEALTAPVNALSAYNPEITIAMLGATDQAHRTQLLKWIVGHDVLDEDGDTDITEARKHMGDPLHSIPHLVTYGGTEKSPDITIYYSTNEGFIHAVDAATGRELFAFMPEALFSNIRTQFTNSGSFSHPYGMDGSIVSWVKDNNFNNKIESGKQDFVYIYAGMRRGGKNYYALDVTKREAPELLWQIEGGSGQFTKLGQTWSKPVKAKVQIGDTERDVLLFAGGFDPAIDNTPNGRVTSTIGNAIYMVDAVDKELLWMASKNIPGSYGLNAPDMQYAIPSDLSVIDMNFDGLADQIYVGDMGGQLWRFDIINGNKKSELVQGGVIADLGRDTPADARRFFFRPDIALVGAKGTPKLAIALGSGHLNEPLERLTDNKFYVILQDDIYGPPESGYTTLTETDLDDRTNDFSGGNTTSGWYMDLDAMGEKNLSSPLIVNGRLLFTTYEPAIAANACSGVTGIGRLYLMDLATAKPSDDLDNSDSLDRSDRSRTLTSPSIPPTPKLLFPEEASQPVLLVGPEQPIPDVQLLTTDEWQPVFWMENR